jgi:hypothetical protein
MISQLINVEIKPYRAILSFSRIIQTIVAIEDKSIGKTIINTPSPKEGRIKSNEKTCILTCELLNTAYNEIIIDPTLSQIPDLERKFINLPYRTY